MQTVKEMLFGTPPPKPSPQIVVEEESSEEEEDQQRVMSDVGVTDSGSESGVKSEKETSTKTKRTVTKKKATGTTLKVPKPVAKKPTKKKTTVTPKPETENLGPDPEADKTAKIDKAVPILEPKPGEKKNVMPDVTEL